MPILCHHKPWFLALTVSKKPYSPTLAAPSRSRRRSLMHSCACVCLCVYLQGGLVGPWAELEHEAEATAARIW